MSSDAFHREILRRLGDPLQPLDPSTFERCVCDLLRDDYPTLVPIPGGDDAGMDGAIADGKGPAYPLICTTSKKVIENLTSSIKSYLDKGGRRRKAVSVTSQELTPRQRRNLEARAERFGFKLVQVFTRSSIADRLYQSPRWCHELLDLTGQASVLSTEPRTSRPLTGGEIVGREAELDWLKQANGDRLLVGRPGSGKTSLLYSLVQAGWGLFLVGEDLARVADEVRSKRPRVIVVDDAHVDPQRLDWLAQIRREVGADFRIVACSWPGDRDKVAERLGLTQGSTRELPPLTRGQIVSIIEACGLIGPKGLIGEIVNQAAGLPGLAVTLATMCLKGDVASVALGTAIRRTMVEFLEKTVGPSSVELLACFALGGDGGMSWRGAAQALDRSKSDVRERLARLEASGVAVDAGEGYLAIRPETLRYALVRDFFFNSSITYEVEELMQAARRTRSVVETLIGARAVDAQVPPELLWRYVSEHGTHSTWREYARLGSDEATRVLQERPDLFETVVGPALVHIPERVIPVLLDRAAEGRRMPFGSSGHPLGEIEDWIKEAGPGSGRALRCRRILRERALAWYRDGGDEAVAMKAFAIGCSPRWKITENDPGSNRSFTLSFGYLNSEDLLELGRSVSESIPMLPPMTARGLVHVVGGLRAWVYPDSRLRKPGAERILNVLQSAAVDLMSQVVPLTESMPGLQQALSAYARALELDVPIHIDPEYEVLHPDLAGGEDWAVAEARRQDATRRLALSWIHRGPEWVACRIRELAKHASDAQSPWPAPAMPGLYSEYAVVLCETLAASVDDPGIWLEALYEAKVSGSYATPFLRALLDGGRAEWATFARKLLEHAEWALGAIELILTNLSSPPALLDAAIAKLDETHAHRIRGLALDGRIPESTLLRLLRHENANVAFLAAAGEWQAEPSRSVRESLRTAWREAVLGARPDPITEHLLCEILESDADLAFSWLSGRIGREPWVRDESDRSVEVLSRHLDAPRRRKLLALIPEDHWDSHLIAVAVGDDLETYREFLHEERWRDRWSLPLEHWSRHDRDGESIANPTWLAKARLALEAGKDPADVARIRFFWPMTWAGNRSLVWQTWIEHFQSVERSSESPLAQLAREIIRIAQEHREQDLRREAREEVYGL